MGGVLFPTHVAIIKPWNAEGCLYKIAQLLQNVGIIFLPLFAQIKSCKSNQNQKDAEKMIDKISSQNNITALLTLWWRVKTLWWLLCADSGGTFPDVK